MQNIILQKEYMTDLVVPDTGHGGRDPILKINTTNTGWKMKSAEGSQSRANGRLVDQDQKKNGNVERRARGWYQDKASFRNSCWWNNS